MESVGLELAGSKFESNSRKVTVHCTVVTVYGYGDQPYLLPRTPTSAWRARPNPADRTWWIPSAMSYQRELGGKKGWLKIEQTVGRLLCIRDRIAIWRSTPQWNTRLAFLGPGLIISPDHIPQSLDSKVLLKASCPSVGCIAFGLGFC